MTEPGIDDFRAARAELDAVIVEIQQVDGFADFLSPPTFEDIGGAAGTPLVYLAAAAAGGFALVVRDGEVTQVALPELTAQALTEAAGSYAYQQETFRRDPSEQTWQQWSDSLDTITAWLWTAAMGPVIGELTPEPEDLVALVPCGLLALLPLHAAWTPDPATPTGRRYAIDHAAWAYTANARALAASREIAGSTGLDRSVVVADPQRGRALPAIAAVSAAVKELVAGGPAVLHGEAATKAATLAALDDADLLHLACHGRARLDDPLRSHVVLADEDLTLEEILRTPRRIRLAVLAACETAMVGADLPDEVVSLPTGLVQAGAATVVAAGWACDQVPTALLLTDFYRRLRTAPAAVALAGAQRWLRDVTAGELRDQWERALDDGEPWLPAETGDELLTLVTFDPGIALADQPWSSPALWAAMTCTGA